MDKKKKNTFQRKPGDPIFTIPPYKTKRVVLAAAEIIDWGLEILGISNLWRFTKGKRIKVAVLDTGVDYNHPDLSGAILDLEDFTNSKYGTFDYDGHGTHVAGIIAARKDSRGVVGVAPECQLLCGKVLGDDGYGYPDQLVNGIHWAIDRGAHIINLSLGSSQEDDSVHQATKDAIEKGIHVICAAGNSGPWLDSVEYPAKHPETVAVGAIDREWNVANFSSRGDMVDIVAPGVDILSTYPSRKYAVLRGTSMACPFVCGIVALMLAKHRDYSGDTPITNYQELKEHLQKTAIDLGLEGFDPDFGWGLINPEELLESKAARALNLILNEDLTKSGIQKLQEKFGPNLQALLEVTNIEGSIRDGAGKNRCGLQIRLSKPETSK